jgi:hypothetical protein
VDALRHFLESFRLPGESPVIARILETFSEHWLVCNKEELGKVFANRDAVYVLCYAILMLNTDQYSTQVKKRMSLEVMMCLALCSLTEHCLCSLMPPSLSPMRDIMPASPIRKDTLQMLCILHE